MKITFTFFKQLPLIKKIKKKLIFKIQKYVCTVYDHSLSKINITNIQNRNDIQTLKKFFTKKIKMSIKSIHIDNIFIFVPFISIFKFNFYQVYHELKSNLSEKYFTFLNEESFHGITLKPLIKKSAPSFLLYRSGKIIVMGKFEVKEILKIIKFIHQVIRRNKVRNGERTNR